MRLLTKRGYDWTKRNPLIVASAHRIRSRLFVLDGEAVLLDVRGISDFDALHSGRRDDEVQFYAFDIIA